MAEQRAPVPFYDSTGKPLPSLSRVIRPGTCAAVFNERGEILLQKRADNGFWSMPGGAVDPGESVEQGAIREVWEETGLHVRVVRLVGVYSDPRNYMITQYPGGDIGHFPCDALPEPMMPSHLIRLKDVLARQPEPFIR